MPVHGNPIFFKNQLYWKIKKKLRKIPQIINNLGKFSQTEGQTTTFENSGYGFKFSIIFVATESSPVWH
jgi:hypothetical protein